MKCGFVFPNRAGHLSCQDRDRRKIPPFLLGAAAEIDPAPFVSKPFGSNTLSVDYRNDVARISTPTA
jgi:hypothetical protein